MGRIFLIDLEGCFFRCKHCFTHLVHVNDIVPKNVSGRYPGGFLTAKVVNVILGRRKERRMVGGLHTIAGIYCVKCGSLVGLKFLFAYEITEKYKEGLFLLLRYQLTTHHPPLLADA